MTYPEALERLFALRRFGVRPGLDAIRAALAVLGDPHAAFPAIHVAGTNGKGSTAALCDAALRAEGLRTGLYTSPHLSRFTERVRVDGVELAEDVAGALAAEVLRAGPTLTFFEVATALAFVAFARARVDVAVVEVGLGGRLDATNVLTRPLVSVVTSIGLEHTDVLGPTTSAIAREKAGILRAGVPAVVGRVDPDARAAIAAVAAAVGAPVAWLGTDFGPRPAPSLSGAHQADNAGVAVAALERLPTPLRPSADAIVRGLAGARWPGRLEQLAPDLIVDGAHNADGALALAAALPALADGRPITLVLGVVEDKDARALAAPLLPACAHVIATTAASPRARSAASLATLLDARSLEIVDDPLDAVRAARARRGLTVVAGSLFLVGHVRAAILGERVDPVSAQDPSTREKL